MFVRQLALVLRTALSTKGADAKKTSEAYRQVYCWQYVKCLEAWANVLASHSDKVSEGFANRDSCGDWGLVSKVFLDIFWRCLVFWAVDSAWNLLVSEGVCKPGFLRKVGSGFRGFAGSFLELFRPLNCGCV